MDRKWWGNADERFFLIATESVTSESDQGGVNNNENFDNRIDVSTQQIIINMSS